MTTISTSLAKQEASDLPTKGIKDIKDAEKIVKRFLPQYKKDDVKVIAYYLEKRTK